MQTLNERDSAQTAANRGFGPSFQRPLALETEITRVHRRHEGQPVPVRESAVLAAMFPAMLGPIDPADTFAGRVRYPLVGFSPEPMGLGYYCNAAGIRALIDSGELDARGVVEAEAIMAYWHGRTTTERVRAAYPAELRARIPSDAWCDEPGIAFPLYRIAGTELDYGTLIRLGLPGLRARVTEPQVPAALREGWLGALAVYDRCLEHSAAQAAALAREGVDPDSVRRMRRIAEACTALRHRPAATFFEAIQAVWLYVMVSGTWNYGRMDTYLGPKLAADLAEGRIDEAGALDLTCALWRAMAEYDNQYNNRVIVGGVGRPDPTAADRFALLAIEATRRVRLNQPQLTLRFHAGQAPALYDRAIDAIGEGCTFPMLYNDDVNVPAVEEAFRVPREEAEQYLPFGCGEYMLDHRGVGSPNGVVNMLHALNTALGSGEGFADFEAVWAAYERVVDRHVEALADQAVIEYAVCGQDAPFLFLSLLTDDCVARGQALFEGGARYLGGTLETYGNTNTADSLTAIRRLVFEERRHTLPEIVAACRDDFRSRPDLAAALAAAPKYGNDDPVADAMALRVHRHVCETTRDQAGRVGLHSFLVVIINNWANAVLGAHTAASPDGRRAGAAMANANNPAPGADRAGVTAFLNSIAKPDPSIHAGAVQNMKFSRDWFTRHRAKFEGLLGAYFEAGGTQAMITVVSRDDLESAMREPEKWGHLMVRVGGFSIRFVDLPYAGQVEVLARTLH